MLAHARLRSVDIPEQVTPQHMLRTQTAKTELYGLIAQFYLHYEQVVLQGNWRYLRPMVQRTLLLPAPDLKQTDWFIRLTAASFVATAV